MIPSAAGPTWPQPAWRAVLLVLLCLLGYASAPRAGFVYDDDLGVAQNPVVTGEVPFSEVLSRDFWGLRPSSNKTYRPAVVAAETLEWRLSNGSPGFMHGITLFLHCCLMVVLYRVWRTIVSEDIAWAGALLMAVIAAPSEVVLTIVGQADLLSGIFVTLGLAAHRRKGAMAVLAEGLLLLLAISSKESALVAPVAWFLLDFVFPQPQQRTTWPARMAACFIGAALAMAVRWHALGDVVPFVSGLNNPLLGEPLLNRLLGAGRVFLTKYVRGIADPTWTQYDCSFAACLPGSPTDAVAWIGLLLAVACVLTPILTYRRFPHLAAGLGWFAIFFAPTSNFVILAGAIYGGRWLYQPLLGFSFAVAGGLFALAERAKRPWLSWAFLSCLLLANLSALQLRALEWQSPLNLFESGLENGSQSAVVQRNMAEAYIKAGDGKSALPYARQALVIAPDFSFGHETLAIALDMTGQSQEAEKEFQTALQMGDVKSGYLNYATFLARRGQMKKALEIARQGLVQPGASPTNLVKLAEQLAEEAKATDK